MDDDRLSRLAAFADDPSGGNPAGVWIDEVLPPTAEMQRIAAEVGASETVFLATVAAGAGPGAWTTRYYSPEAEVSFCGHATIAAGVALAGRHGDATYVLHTPVGEVPVAVGPGPAGLPVASLTSVEPRRRDCPPHLLDAVLRSLGWDGSVLDAALPTELAFAGAWHLVLPLAERATLAALSYDFAAMREALEAEAVTTVQLVWRADATTFHARNPFPVGGVVEDPATGAAAAALGGSLRAHGLVDPPADLVVLQGHDMGRPSRIAVHIPVTGGIRVAGTAVPLAVA